MKTLGYLGLGVMGYGMTGNLIDKSGCDIYGYDPVPALRERFAARGGKVLDDAKTLYKTCDIIFMCLPTNAIVKATITEIMETARPGTTIVDMGSTSPYVIQELHAAAVEKGFHLLDSPVSGGETGANGGTLVIMCGGEKEVFDEVRPYLLMMGKTATYMGPSGCGSTAKVANNMMVGIHLCAMGEAFAFAKKAGLDPQTLFDAIKGGFAQSAVMDGKVPKLLSRDFSASARIAVHLKDINNAMDVAAHLGVELPMTEIVKEQMDWMDARDRRGPVRTGQILRGRHGRGNQVISRQGTGNLRGPASAGPRWFFPVVENHRIFCGIAAGNLAKRHKIWYIVREYTRRETPPVRFSRSDRPGFRMQLCAVDRRWPIL